jgi:hypothetical protein
MNAKLERIFMDLPKSMADETRCVQKPTLRILQRPHHTDSRDTSDLERGWDQVAVPSDWGTPETRPTLWHHVGAPPSPKVGHNRP